MCYCITHCYKATWIMLRTLEVLSLGAWGGFKTLMPGPCPDQTPESLRVGPGNARPCVVTSPAENRIFSAPDGPSGPHR